MSELQRELLNDTSDRSDSGKYCLENYTSGKTLKIKDKKITNFFERYCNIIYSGVPLKLGESIDGLEETPLVGFFVFEFDPTPREEDYFEEDFQQCIADIYCNVMRESFKNYSEKFERCVFAETDEPEINPENGNFLFTLRIQFPYVRINKNYYSAFLKPRLIQELRKGVSHKFVGMRPLGDWNEWLQDFQRSIPLYGSNSYKHSPAKRVTFYNDNDFFEPRKFQFIKDGSCDDTFLQEDEKEKYYPLLFSIYFSKGILAVPATEIEEESIVPLFETGEGVGSRDPRQMVKFLLPLLSNSRYRQENYWLDIGRALYTIYEGDEVGLTLFIEYSVRGKRKAEECESVWEDLKDSHISHRTIGFYAREDSKDNYDRWHEEWCRSAIDLALDRDQDPIAESIYRYFWLDYIYVGEAKTEWLKFEKTHYRRYKKKEIMPLKNDILDKYVNDILTRMRINIDDKIRSGVSTNRERTQLQGEVDKISELIKKMRGVSFCDTVIRGCQRYFYIDGVLEFLDDDPEKLATKNWVLEVCNGKVVSRKGKPEDYISKTTGNYYHKEWTIENEWVKKLIKIYDQMMVGDADLFDYFMRLNASYIRGRNLDKIAPILTGDGDNGKSVYGRILQAAYGSYCVQFPVEVISARAMSGSSGGARPEIVQATGARVAVTSEPDEGKIKTNTYKSLTGDDPIWVRGLFEEGGLMMQFFKFLLMCNRVPQLTEIDNAIINRIVIIPFLAKFIYGAPEDEEEQYRTRTFPRDDDLNHYARQLGEAHLWLSVYYYDEYAKRNIRTCKPKIVIEHTEHHWDEADTYINFIKEKMEKVSDSIRVGRSKVFGEYKKWYSDNHGGRSGMNLDINSFTKLMENKKRLGPCDRQDMNWIGWRLKMDEESF